MITVGASLGAKGVISVLSNIAPKFTDEMTKAAIDGKLKESANMQKKAIVIINALFSDVNPIPVKEAMSYLGYCESSMRLPLCCMTPFLKENLIKTIEEYKSILY